MFVLSNDENYDKNENFEHVEFTERDIIIKGYEIMKSRKCWIEFNDLKRNACNARTQVSNLETQTVDYSV